MFKVSNENTRKKCEICPGGKYLEKNVWEGIPMGEFSEEGVIVQRRNIWR